MRGDRFVDLPFGRGAPALGGAAWIAAPAMDDWRHRPGQSRYRKRTGCVRPPDDSHRGLGGGRGGLPGNPVPEQTGGVPHSDHAGDTAAARGHAAGRHHHQSGTRGSSFLGHTNHAPRDLREPGGHRHRERPAVPGAPGAEPRADRGPRAGDRHRRGPEGDQPLDVRSAARVGDARRERDAAVWRRRRAHRPRRRRSVQDGRRVRCPSCVR